MADETSIASADQRTADAFRAGFELSRAASYAEWQEAFRQWSGAPALEKHVAGRITPQMIRDTAGWSQSEDDLRDTLRRAADELERALAAAPAPETHLDGPVEHFGMATALYELLMMAKNDGVASVTDPAWVQKDFTATEVYKTLFKALTTPAPVPQMTGGDDWFSQVASFLVKHGMLDERDEYDIADVMAALADNYEPRSTSEGDAIDAIQRLMETKRLARKDIFPAKSRASEYLSRKRPLSIATIRKLHFEHGIPAEVLISPYRPATTEGQPDV